MGDSEFDDAWAEGTALSIDEAIAYAQRGRGARKRPTSGWGALTPTELEVALLVGEGLSNKEIGVRLFISPRTVHSHLTHVYTKLGLSSVFNSRSKLRAGANQNEGRRGHSQGRQPATKGHVAAGDTVRRYGVSGGARCRW